MIKISGPIPIFITPFFWIMAALIGWFSTMAPFETLLWMIVILISVLFHEMGHALTAVAFGQKVIIELTGYGGVTIRRNPKPLGAWKEFFIGLNGPLAGFLLCGIAYALLTTLQISPQHSVVGYMLSVAFLVNLYWTVLNLLPVQPLDGGKLLRVALEGIFGVIGTKIACVLSVLFAAVAGIYFFTIQMFLAGSIFFILAFEGFRDLQLTLKMTDRDKDDDMLKLMQQASRDADTGKEQDALQKFMDIREKTKSGVLYNFATQAAGSILALKGDNGPAYELLSSMKNSLSPRGLQLLHRVSYELGKLKEAADLGVQSYQALPDYETALMNAYANARLGEVKPALGWIQCAINEGIPHPENIFRKEEFQKISNDPAFLELRDRYARNGS